MRKIRFYFVCIFIVICFSYQMTGCSSPSAKETVNPKTAQETAALMEEINNMYELTSTIEIGVNEFNQPLEWVMLEKTADKALLVYNGSEGIKNMEFSGSWKESDLRKWLNIDFYQQSFREAEKAVIAQSEIKTCTGASAYSGNVHRKPFDYLDLPDNALEMTSDKIFILSCDEWNNYARQLNTAKIPDSYYMEWIRESCTEDNIYAQFNNDKKTGSFHFVNSSSLKASVRPAMWVHLQ